MGHWSTWCWWLKFRNIAETSQRSTLETEFPRCDWKKYGRTYLQLIKCGSSHYFSGRPLEHLVFATLSAMIEGSWDINVIYIEVDYYSHRTVQCSMLSELKYVLDALHPVLEHVEFNWTYFLVVFLRLGYLCCCHWPFWKSCLLTRDWCRTSWMDCAHWVLQIFCFLGGSFHSLTVFQEGDVNVCLSLLHPYWFIA